MFDSLTIFADNDVTYQLRWSVPERQLWGLINLILAVYSEMAK